MDFEPEGVGDRLRAPDRFRSGGGSSGGWCGGVDGSVGEAESEFAVGPSSMIQPSLWILVWCMLQTGMRLSRSVVPPLIHQMMWWSLQRS